MNLVFLFEQGGLLNTWTVVAKSAEYAFGWSDRELQLMQMWIYVSYLLAMLPFAWLLDKRGIVLLGQTFFMLHCDVFQFSNSC